MCIRHFQNRLQFFGDFLKKSLTMVEWLNHVSNISAKEEKASPSPWVFKPLGYSGWPENPQATQAEGANPYRRLIMLSRSHRVPKNSFRSLPRGRSFSTDSLTIRVSSTPDRDTLARFSVIVSKKTAKTAVLRNRLRRRIFSATERFVPHSMPGAIVLIYPKIEVRDMSFPALEGALGNLLSEAGVLRTS